MVTTKTKLDNLRALSQLLAVYPEVKKVYCETVKTLLYRKVLFFVDLEGRLVVHDVTHSSKSFRSVGIYAPQMESTQNDFSND